MELYEKIAREAHDRHWPNFPFSTHSTVVRGMLDAAKRAFDAARAVSDLERRALDAWKAYTNKYYAGKTVTREIQHARSITHELLEFEKPKGPWKQNQDVHWQADHKDGNKIYFYDKDGAPNPANCAAFVAEQNEKEASRG